MAPRDAARRDEAQADEIDAKRPIDRRPAHADGGAVIMATYERNLSRLVSAGLGKEHCCAQGEQTEKDSEQGHPGSTMYGRAFSRVVNRDEGRSGSDDDEQCTAKEHSTKRRNDR